MAAALGPQASDATLGEEEETELSAKLPSNELGFRPLRLPDEAAEFFGDLALDEDMATLEILPGEGDAVEALRCHASVLALRSAEIMHELLLNEEPPTPDEPLVLEVRARPGRRHELPARRGGDLLAGARSGSTTWGAVRLRQDPGSCPSELPNSCAR